MATSGVLASPGDSPPRRAGIVSRAWDRLLFLILQVAYLRFRYDVFISYRRHHRAYVEKLKQQLEHVGYRAFFDREDCPPGSALTTTLERALLRSAALVLVGSPDVASQYVTMEVTTFSTTGRSIIPIDIDGSLINAPISAIHERDLVWINESGAALDVGVPSPEVVAGIESNFVYLKRSLRQRIEGLLVAVLVIAIAAGSVQYARRNVAAARQQEQAAVARTQVAEATATAADGKRIKAEADATAAEQLKQDALRLREAARRAAQEEQGQRAALLAAEAGREHDALLAGVFAVGPEVAAGRVPPAAARYGVTEAVAAALRSLPIDAGWTHDARVSDDGRRIVSLGRDGIRWWETESGRLIRHVRTTAQSVRAAFCGDSGLIVTGATGRTARPAEIRFHDSATGSLWAVVRPGAARTPAACSRDRQWAVMGMEDGQQHLWRLQPAQDLGAFPSQASDASPHFSADGTRLVSGSGLFEIPSRRLIAPLQNPARAGTRTNVMQGPDFHLFAFFGQDRFIAGASPLGNVVIWNAENGTQGHDFEVSKPRYGVNYLGTRERVHNTIDAMTISPDGKHIAIADIDNRITVWSTQPGTKEPVAALNVLAIEDAPQRLKISLDGFGQAEYGAVTALRFFDDHTLVFITEAGRAYIHRFDNFGLQKRVALQEPRFITDESAFKAGLKPSFTFDRRGRELVTFGCFAGMRRWSLPPAGFPSIDPPLMMWGNEALRSVLRGPARLTTQAGARSSSGAALRMRDILPTGKPASLDYSGTSRTTDRELTAEDFRGGIRSPSGRLLASCCPGTVWDVADRRRIFTLPAFPRFVQFAPDDKDLVTSPGDGSYSVYSLDPAWYLHRACQLLRDADRPKVVDFCPAAGR